MEDSPIIAPAAEAFSRQFRALASAMAGADQAGTGGAAMSFAAFMDLALYDAEVGYYRRDRERVGRAGADFQTAASLSLVFGPLVAAAAKSLLGTTDLGEITFVEIGAEPGRSVLAGVHHGFREVRTLRVGDTLDLEGNLVVFSNELFDAQPFHRVVRRDGGWREAGVQLVDKQLTWIELPEMTPAVAAIGAQLPATAPEGYVLDLPLAAARLAQSIASEPWRGVFLAFDYGRIWNQLTTEYPGGTGRAYWQHRQSDDLLARPGKQDLTCHVCWDWLEEALRSAGFAARGRESQEAFFVRRATAAVQAIVTGDPDPLSLSRTQLKHLLHPAIMGQRFEVLWGTRI